MCIVVREHVKIRTFISALAIISLAHLGGAIGRLYTDEDLRRLLEDESFNDFQSFPDENTGAFDIMISALADKILTKIENEAPLDRVSSHLASTLRHRLKGLYAHLKDHPALMARRLHVGSQKPTLPPDDHLWMNKRQHHSMLDIAQSVCPSHAEWQLLFEARDINDTTVEVYQPLHGSQGHQWFYTVTCNQQVLRNNRQCPGCCRGIDHRRYNSSCRPKKTYVMAVIRKPTETEFDWNWIQVATSCNCAFTPKFNP